jgi:hypothetical protein
MASINPKKSILQITKPSIVLDELSTVNTSSGEGDQGREDFESNNTQKQSYGFDKPLIKINNIFVSGLQMFTLDLSGFIPTLIFRFQTIDERFLFTSYPKDGDIISLYIRALGEEYKPLRMDFIITEVIAPLSSNMGDRDSDAPSGRYITFTIRGETRIPKIYKHICKAIKGSSYDALVKISNDLGLGFSSNEKKTFDEMTWISPNLDYYSFIRNVSSASWLSDEDYFECWIDQYYNLNFVNMRRQFDENNEVEILKLPYGVDENKSILGGTKPIEGDFPLIFTNASTSRKYPTFITAFSVEHNAGRINNDLGYFQNIQFYDSKLVSDKPKNKFVTYNIESVTNKNLGTRDTLNKGRLGENLYKDEIKKTYIGTVYHDNTHENIQQALVQNILNKNDNYKMLLRIKNRAWTPFVYRGQNILVNIVHEGSTTVASDSKNYIGKDPARNSTKDPESRKSNLFLSGNYVILGIEINYKKSEGISQTLILGKKEWTLNPGVASDPETLDETNVE